MKKILLFFLFFSFACGATEKPKPPLRVGGGAHSTSPDGDWYISITNYRDGTPVRIAIWNMEDVPFSSFYFKGDKTPEFEARVRNRIHPRGGKIEFVWNDDSTYLIVYFYCHRTEPPTKKEFHYDFKLKNFLVRNSEVAEVEPGGTGQPMQPARKSENHIDH